MIQHITRLIAIRLVFTTVALVLGAFLLRIEPTPFYYVIAILYLLTILYTLLLVRRVWSVFSLYLQIFIDLVLETVIIHYSGGVDSVFVFLYIPTVVFGSYLFPGRGSGIITGSCIIAYSAMVTAEYYGYVGTHMVRWNSYSEGRWVVLYLVCFRAVIISFASYLSSYLSRSLAEKTRELFRVNTLSARILEAMTGGVITTDRNDMILFANNYAQQILDIPIHNLIGTHWRGLFPVDESMSVFDQGAPSTNIDIPVATPGGETKIFNINISYLFDEREEPTGKVIIFYDVTELRELRQKVRQNEKLVMMGEMASDMAHEIRNPLASICGSIEMLKEQGGFDRKAQKLVEIILKEGEHLNMIIEEFLYYTKGKPPALRAWNLVQLVSDIVAMLRALPRFADGTVKLAWRPPERNVVVSIDADQIKQVVINMVNNAADAMPNGGEIAVSVLAESDAAGRWARLTVADTGVGIPRQFLKRIFEPFFSTKDAGYGIGLALSQKIVENHLGTIDVWSEEGKGSRFTVSLPLAHL
ncbi:MAG TPA: ATP-binding protein [bacterium]|nr:ATP-binding protein [bacterium]